jgi:hypothetical protein
MVAQHCSIPSGRVRVRHRISLTFVHIIGLIRQADFNCVIRTSWQSLRTSKRCWTTRFSSQSLSAQDGQLIPAARWATVKATTEAAQ